MTTVRITSLTALLAAAFILPAIPAWSDEPAQQTLSLQQTGPGIGPNHRASDADRRSYWAHTFSSGAHSVAVHGRDVYAAWYDVRNGDSDVIFTKSTDGGKTFGRNIRVNDDSGKAKQYKPSLSVDAEGRIYIVWRDDRRGHADIYFARSEDGGRTFSKNKLLNDDSGWAYQGNPTVGVSPEGNVYAAWSDNRNGQDDIYMAVSRDKGKSFGKNIQLNDDTGRAVQSHPAVGAGPGGLVVAAWEDFRNGQPEVYVTRSTDAGKSFEPNRPVGPAVSPASAGAAAMAGLVQISPSIAVNAKGWVAIAWAGFGRDGVTLAPPNAAVGETKWWGEVRLGNADIYLSFSTDGGAQFGLPIRVNDDTSDRAQAFPSVALDERGGISVAWEDFRHGQADIYLAQLQQGLVAVLPNRIVNDDSGGVRQYHPSVAVDTQGKPYLLWTDGRGNPFVSSGHTETDAQTEEEGNDVYFAGGQ
jgi:hypothetical protein